MLSLIFVLAIAWAQDGSARLAPNSHCKGAKHLNESALALWTMENKIVFAVCEGSGFTVSDKDTYSGWINLAQKIGKKIIAIIPEVKSEKVSEIYTFTIKKINNSEIHILRNLKPLRGDIGDENFVVMKRKVVCNKPDYCIIGKERCVDFKKPLTEDHKKAIAKVREVVAGKLKVEELGMYDSTIAALGDAAVAGDKESQKLMLDTKLEKLKLDGAAAENYEDSKYMLEKLKALKCI